MSSVLSVSKSLDTPNSATTSITTSITTSTVVSSTSYRTSTAVYSATSTSSPAVIHNGTPPAAALTTIFTPPLGCPTAVTTLPSQLSCMPSGYNEYLYDSAGYYSPAICPTGYTIGCSREPSGGNLGPSLEPTETAMMCCPSQYACAPSSAGFCVHAQSTDSPLAYGLQIRWAATDLPNLQTDPMKALVTASPTASSLSARQSSSITQSTTSTPTPAGSSSNSESDNSFPLYAKIGVGAGVGLLLLLIALSTCIIVRRRRKSRPSDSERPSGSDESRADMEGDEKPPMMATANEILNIPTGHVSSKRSSRSRTNSNLATLPENAEVGKRGHISWQPEIQQREITHPEPFSPDMEPSRQDELDRPSSIASRHMVMGTAPLSPVSGRASPRGDPSGSGRVSGRASPSIDYLSLGKQPISRVSPSPDRRSRTSPSPNADLGRLGTSMTPDVDADNMRTVEAAWQTFFDTSPSPEHAPPTHGEFLRGQQFADPDPPITPLTEEEELAALRKQRTSMEEKRLRLMQLDRLDDELEQVNARIKRAEAKRRREMRVG